MEQRKQFMQEEFERMQQYLDHELTIWPRWLHDLLSTHGEVHQHRDTVVRIFTRTMHVLGYQPSSIISWGRSFQTATGRIIWMLRTRNFPGPNVQKATGDEFYQFFHVTSAQGLLGIMKTGLILPSATDRMGLPDTFPVSAFFSLLKHTHQQMTVEELALQCASLFHHTKQQSGVMLSGCVTGGHTKYPWSSTWVELNLATCAGLVRPVSHGSFNISADHCCPHRCIKSSCLLFKTKCASPS